jgi:hypothetical protein
VRRLVDRQPAERPQFDNLRKAAIDLLEAVQRVIQSHDRDLG